MIFIEGVKGDEQRNTTFGCHFKTLDFSKKVMDTWVGLVRDESLM